MPVPPQPIVSSDTTQRITKFNALANKNPKEFIRIFEQGKRNDTPAFTPSQDL